MVGFALLLGHLVGDYIVQNDWMALNKTNLYPGSNGDVWCKENNKNFLDYWHERDRWLLGHLACTVHCFLYTMAVWCFSFWWMPWWGLLVCFLIHWPIDRFRLACWWMVKISGQKKFASGPLAPWSIIVVDNIFHLLTLYVILVIHESP